MRRRAPHGSHLDIRDRGGRCGGLAVERLRLDLYRIHVVGSLLGRGRAHVLAAEHSRRHPPPVQTERRIQAEPLGHQHGRRHLVLVGAHAGAAVGVGRVPAYGAPHRQRRILAREARLTDDRPGGHLAAPRGASGDIGCQDGHCATPASLSP
ncbi:hypothetical protein [Nonomuraea longicatena]|uniref:hypothetical protein n=1 Tax=Nonomuraea longicatena TaxID=83682 RepID=UPI0031CE7AC7